jgi:ATP-dependent exoDNAse (exonuclease V) alpha subunit
MTKHLNVRVAWHDNKWSGVVCNNPSGNAFCLDLDRIREGRDDAAEDALAGKHFADLKPEQLPPCIAESGAFMSPREWHRLLQHPYQDIPKASATHGMLRPTVAKIPPYSTFAIPFLWMLRDSQERIDEALPTPLPPDEPPPFKSPWVFGRARQESLGDLFFDQLVPKKSMVFFYTKSGHPLSESINRLVVGVGEIASIGSPLRYNSEGPESYPVWDRIVSHSIRPDGADGFLLPYHEYLQPTGDPEEDARRSELLAEIAVVPEPTQLASFSFAGEHSTPDVALSTLVGCLESVRKIRAHGIASGPWEKREEWLNSRISETWQDRGAFPGAGAALEALGMRLGTSLLLELMSNGSIGPLEDPWPVLDSILRGASKPPQKAYDADIAAVRNTWVSLEEERRSLVQLLSRFSLTPAQAKRWYEPKERQKAVRSAVTDAQILSNPYRIAEVDLGDAKEYPVTIGVIDRGLLPDATVASKHPVPDPSRIESPLDARRVRAALVSVLRSAGEQGDTLLSQSEALTRLEKLNLAHPCAIPADWLSGNQEWLKEEIHLLSLPGGEGIEQDTPCLQLSDVKEREAKLASILSKRAEKPLPSLSENWQKLLAAAIEEGGGTIDRLSLRHKSALEEQATALERVTTRRLSVLVGRAGTGKTTVLGALLKSSKLAQEGVLFLAPTGKARVRITQQTNQTAMTVAQFLYQLGRYDGSRQRPLFTGNEQYRKEKTVVIDECSMLTLDDLAAVLLALDLAHVQRVILVGDPNQLPPIGIGRPFADLVAHLDAVEKDKPASSALARLTIELRTSAGGPSDALRLASWYTREPQPVDADRVLSDMELGEKFNDLSIVYWRTPEELHARIGEQLVERLGLSNPSDVVGFNRALGLTPEGWVPFDDHNGADRFQILSPVRSHPYGVHDLNRMVQRRFRAKQLNSSRNPWGLSLGDEEIVWGDKVILTRNGKRDGWNGKTKKEIEEYLANGEIGTAASGFGDAKNKLLNIAFTGRPDVRFGFSKKQFSNSSSPLELAYALTVHKAQGSEFGTVFVILPKQCRLMTRELLYTALTRARQHLVLMVEGEDASFLYDLTRPERSETARRNSNLFSAGIRHEADGVPYAEHLIHRTKGGELVRSKSELVIANHLHEVGLKYHYERVLEGTADSRRLRPDFTFVDDAGDLVLWEHLGMLDRDDYRKSWEWKKAWYEMNGFVEGRNLFTSSEVNGLQMPEIERVAALVREAIN